MRILIVTPYYPPDGGPGSPLFGMLSEALVRRGHQVTILASVPHYPTGHVLPEYRGMQVRKAIENGVNVIRVPVPSMDRSNISIMAFVPLILSDISRKASAPIFNIAARAPA